MRKLLSANFARLWKSRVFWLLEGFCFGFGVFVYALVAYNTRNLGPGYLTGGIRTFFGWLTAILPSGSMMLSLDKNLSFNWRNPVCAVALTALLTVTGIGVFKKKDIK